MSRKSNNSRPNSRMTKADCPCVEEEEVEQPPTPPPAVETAENYTQLSGTSLQADGGSDDVRLCGGFFNFLDRCLTTINVCRGPVPSLMLAERLAYTVFSF